MTKQIKKTKMLKTMSLPENHQEIDLMDKIEAKIKELSNETEMQVSYDDEVIRAFAVAEPELRLAYLRTLAINEVKVTREAVMNIDRLATATLLAERKEKHPDCEIIKMKDELLVVEEDFIRKGLISDKLVFIQNIGKKNKQCLAGVYHLLINNGYVVINEMDHKKSIREIIDFFNNRYKIKSMQEFKQKKVSVYIEMAAERFPVIEGIVRDRRSFMQSKVEINKRLR